MLTVCSCSASLAQAVGGVPLGEGGESDGSAGHALWQGVRQDHPLLQVPHRRDQPHLQTHAPGGTVLRVRDRREICTTAVCRSDGKLVV